VLVYIVMMVPVLTHCIRYRLQQITHHGHHGGGGGGDKVDVSAADYDVRPVSVNRATRSIYSDLKAQCAVNHMSSQPPTIITHMFSMGTRLVWSDFPFWFA
jgi:hypothetical protein